MPKNLNQNMVENKIEVVNPIEESNLITTNNDLYQKSLTYSWELLLKSNNLEKARTKIFGDELICFYPYLNSENKEFNKEIDNMLSFRNNISDDDFGYYLAGLIEGDGSCSEESIDIAFNIYDTPLAKYIRDRLGEGHIYKMKGNSSVLKFKKESSIKKVKNLINGKFYTSYKLDFMLRHNYGVKYKIDLLPPVDSNKYPIDSNYFLAGFTDADSCFDIDKNTLATRYRISQKDTTIINILKEEIGGISFLNKKTLCTEYQAISKDIINKYVKYFDKYKLLSTKYINYIKWKKVLEIKESKKHLTKSGKKEILEIKKGMNSKLYNNLIFSNPILL